MEGERKRVHLTFFFPISSGSLADKSLRGVFAGFTQDFSLCRWLADPEKSKKGREQVKEGKRTRKREDV